MIGLLSVRRRLIILSLGLMVFLCFIEVSIVVIRFGFGLVGRGVGWFFGGLRVIRFLFLMDDSLSMVAMFFILSVLFVFTLFVRSLVRRRCVRIFSRSFLGVVFLVLVFGIDLLVRLVLVMVELERLGGGGGGFFFRGRIANDWLRLTFLSVSAGVRIEWLRFIRFWIVV